MTADLFLILAISLLLTLILEVLFALAAGVRTGRGLLLVVLVNTLTNPPVALLYTLFPSLPIKIALELAAVVTEWFIYKKCADDFIGRPFLFSLCANAFSYLTGALLNHVLPLFFY